MNVKNLIDYMTFEYVSNINRKLHILTHTHTHTHTLSYKDHSTNAHLQVAPKQQSKTVNEEVESWSIYKANKKS